MTKDEIANRVFNLRGIEHASTRTKADILNMVNQIVFEVQEEMHEALEVNTKDNSCNKLVNDINVGHKDTKSCGNCKSCIVDDTHRDISGWCNTIGNNKTHFAIRDNLSEFYCSKHEPKIIKALEDK